MSSSQWDRLGFVCTKGWTDSQTDKMTDTDKQKKISQTNKRSTDKIIIFKTDDNIHKSEDLKWTDKRTSTFVECQHVFNGRTDILVTIIELLRFIIRT